MMTSCLALGAGSCQMAPPDGPLFCDVEKQRGFTAQEVKWRAEHARANLQLDLSTNETGEKHCGWKGKS